MSDMEKLLEGASREANEVADMGFHTIKLKARLLPLLEAGAVLANSKTRNDFNEAVNVWDAALRKAMEL